MMRPTGGGKTEVRTDPPSLMLYNFDIDGDQLKEEHKAFLRREAIPRLTSGASVAVVGLTDRSGADEYNVGLSKRRARHTIEFLQREVANLKLQQPPTGFGEEAAAREREQDGSLNERFRAVLLFLRDAPVATMTRTVEVTVKSFIALIGANTGVMPGTTIIPPAPFPVARQTLLNAMAKVTDGVYNENPRSAAKDKHYRLYSSCRFTIVWEGSTILSAQASALDADVGKEGPLQPPGLITTPVAVSSKGGSFVTFSWSGKGRPHLAAEPTFQTVNPRTSVYIWHIVNGRIDISSGEAVTTVSLKGSQFPAHRAFVNSAPVPAELRQGPFSNLWVPDAGDQSKVR